MRPDAWVRRGLSNLSVTPDSVPRRSESFRAALAGLDKVEFVLCSHFAVDRPTLLAEGRPRGGAGRAYELEWRTP